MSMSDYFNGRMSLLHGDGGGSTPSSDTNALEAQLDEPSVSTRKVAGSSPVESTIHGGYSVSG